MDYQPRRGVLGRYDRLGSTAQRKFLIGALYCALGLTALVVSFFMAPDQPPWDDWVIFAGLYVLLFCDGRGRGGIGALVLVIAASEEVLFRGGWLLSGGDLRPARGRARVLRGLALAALAYGLTSLPLLSPLLLGWMVFCGLSWGLLRLWSGSLWAPLLAHLVWDLAIFVAWPLPR